MFHRVSLCLWRKVMKVKSPSDQMAHSACEATFTSSWGEGMLGDCVARTMHSHLYIFRNKVQVYNNAK